MLTTIAASPGVVSVVTPGMLSRTVGRLAPWNWPSSSPRSTVVTLAMPAAVPEGAVTMISSRTSGPVCWAGAAVADAIASASPARPAGRAWDGDAREAGMEILSVQSM
jgi:hypothetical protein